MMISIDLRRYKPSAIYVLVIFLLFPSYAVAQQKNSHSQPAQSTAKAPEEQTTYTCSMHPQIRLPNPGKCPICGMDLIPVKKQAKTGQGGMESMRELTLSPYAEELAQVETQPVERKFVQTQVRMVGFIDYDETRVASITAWVAGRIDRLYVDFTGTVVRKGDPMVYLYSPQLLTAQQELLQSIRASSQLTKSKLTAVRETTRATITAAKEKLRLWGLTPQQIDDIVKRGKPTDHMTIMAPMSGVVIKKNGLEGMYVQTGTQIYRIADLSQVWIELDAYESDLTWIRVGQEVEFQTKSHPGEVFTGKVAFIDPFLNDKTRTVKVRLNAANPNGSLKPEMFVHAVLRATLAEGGQVVAKPSGSEKPPLVIPASAPLITGKRAVVYLAVPDQPGTYIGREIVLGPRAGDYYVVQSGLQEGEMVVTHGNFMIDSSLQIQAKPSMMTPQGGGEMMHEHAATAAKGKEAKAAVQIPESFRAQLEPVTAAYDKISREMESNDLQKIQRAFMDFKKTITEVDADALSGQPKMLWLELDMLLENDAVVGSDAANMTEAQTAFDELSKDYNRLKQQFGLEKAVPTVELEVPRDFRAQISETLDAYLGVQKALANDRLDRAQEALKFLGDVVSTINVSLLKGEAHDKWMEFFTNLQAALNEMDQAKDLATFRECFAVLSEAMAVVVKTFGIYPQQPVYKMFCPMAFEGQGAIWLQKEDEIHNPYFGSAMPGCGEIMETYFKKDAGNEEVHPNE